MIQGVQLKVKGFEFRV